MDTQDMILEQAMATLAREAEAPASPVQARRTRIVERVERVAPVTGYSVEIAGHVVTLDAEDFGDAVIRGEEALRGTLENVGGYVFMWHFAVTDSTGITLHGEDRLMRESLEAARIRRQG